MELKKMLVLGAGMMSAGAVLAQDRPNIIVFLVDDMGLMDTSQPFLTDGSGNLQSYPLNEFYRTPNMERLARQGILFSTFYAQSVSSPSRACLMTGQNAARHRTTNWICSESNNRTPYGPKDWNWEGLAADCPTLPKVLSAAGYRTMMVGKAHFGPDSSLAVNPLNVGFEVNIGGCGHGQPGSYYGEYGYGWIKGNRKRAVPDLEQYHGSDTFLTEALTLEAIKEIDKSIAAERPFYLYMSHYAVHQPFEVDKRFVSHYEDSGMSRQEIAFATLIEGMDKSLGDLMDHLQEKGVAENTLIIFLGDNGSDAPLGDAFQHASSAPLKGKKGSAYEGGTRVPFIMAWARPDADNVFQRRYPIAEDAVQLQMGTIMDVYPTVLSVADVACPKNWVLDGQDLKKLVAGKRDRRHRDDFLMHFPHEHNCSYFTTYRKGDWKLVYFYHPESPEAPKVELYNLAEDPFENVDLAGERPAVLRKMLRKMTRRLTKEKALFPEDQEGKTCKINRVCRCNSWLR